MKTPKIINAISFVEDDLISAANEQKAKKPFYIKPVFRRATAVAACLAIVAVTAFALINKTNNHISSNNNANSDNISSNNSSQNNQDNNVIYVTGDTADDYVLDGEVIKSLERIYISRALQEKMNLYKDYRDSEVVYKVIVEIFSAGQDIEEGGKIADASPEVEALYQQYLAAREEEDKAEADWRAFNKANPGNEPEIVEKRKELIAICDEKEKSRGKAHSAWFDLRQKILREYCSAKRKERLEFATQFSEKEPVATSNDEMKYYMDLTAEEINILAEKGGYSFRLSNEKIGMQNE